MLLVSRRVSSRQQLRCLGEGFCVLGLVNFIFTTTCLDMAEDMSPACAFNCTERVGRVPQLAWRSAVLFEPRAEPCGCVPDPNGSLTAARPLGKRRNLDDWTESVESSATRMGAGVSTSALPASERIAVRPPHGHLQHGTTVQLLCVSISNHRTTTAEIMKAEHAEELERVA